MYEPLSDSLRKIARGTGIAMLGMVGGLLFQFATKVIIARYCLEANYGIFSMALVVLNFAMVLVCLGLLQGAAVYIAYFRAKGEAAKIRGTIWVSLRLTTIGSIIIGIVLFLSAEAIAVNIFHTPDLVPALRIFAVGLPFFALINVLAAIFRGFDRVEPGVYFQSILLNVLLLLLLVIPVLIGQSFIAVLYTYLAALILTFIALAIYSAKKLPQLAEFTGKADILVWKELLTFSLPLLGSAVLSLIITWTDTLMLGYFKMPEAVGIYNAAYPLAYFVAIPMAALVLIYTPVTANLYSQNLMAELKRNYTVVTKWLAFLTLPLFLVLCLFPEAVLNIFFGSAYVTAAPALRILSLGFIIRNLFGPNGTTLLAMGKSRFIMWVVLTAGIVNVLLNIALIPPLGIVGAAIASAVSLTLGSIISAVKLYTLSRAHPLSKNLLKPLAASVVLAFIFGVAFSKLLTVTLWMLPLLFILYYGIHALITVLTRSFDREDIALLLEIEKRSGINAAPLKKILSRFL